MQTGLKWGPQLSAYTLHIGELGYAWRMGKNGKPGRLGVGAWGQTGNLDTPAFTTEDVATGYYLFANQRLWYRKPDINNSGLAATFITGTRAPIQ